MRFDARRHVKLSTLPKNIGSANEVTRRKRIGLVIEYTSVNSCISQMHNFSLVEF